MIKIGELTRFLSVSPEDAGVLVSHLDDDPPPAPPPPGTAPVAAKLGKRFGAYPLPEIPELYLG
jgi:hypothetical protein